MTKNILDSAQKIYCIGIGGIGVSALAQLLQADGKQVSGEDLTASSVTEMLQTKGIAVAIDSRGEALESADCIVYSSAVPENHPARSIAREKGILELQYFDALGQYMQQFETAIAVSGTHGKTTTTALIANLLVDAGFDPTAVVGSIVKEFGDTNARAGGADKKYIVVEACEHEAHMLKLHPTMIVVTNIEADHLDYYRDLQHITDTFQEFVNQLQSRPAQAVEPTLIVNADDPRAKDLEFEGKRISFGIEAVADLQALNIGVEAGRQFFTVHNHDYLLHIPGQFNINNSLAAIAVGRQLGISEATIAASLKKFHGTWRRFQKLGEFQGATVISDYAHHPTAVRATIRAAKEFFPKRRIVAVFQPHQRARTKELFSDFLNAFVEAGVVIVQEIYDVAGREESEYANVSSQHIVDALKDIEGQVAVFTLTAAKTRMTLEEIVQDGDVVLVMGAGDIYRLAEELAQKES
jgi:UDP-N-acetylmuramate--alanine ligase